jgi:hypothetical protein
MFYLLAGLGLLASIVALTAIKPSME